ncbi:membrane cofactor protein-like isoform X1 [Salarias fasciatus]|uniref:membrane cofactor protein-like isoform X1 n=1 Tax=Salarias fasciatus TaxID=181472 RepID=UPI001176C8D1|nr:membrane cofactor protein-like isoform X1 [Salarias fasciatus]XP_029974876.1 membrane cofactor protein-like isoform X1 [Salarias fasciatus]XP_029974877.1 membrane cofactor protein-like isoform X1 [Salarias fasciatus]
MSVTSLFLLFSLGIAMTVQAQDCSRPLGGPNMDIKGDDITLNSFPDGAKVTFVCDVGYRSAGGSPSVTCTAGKWSDLRMTCERHNCGSAGDVTHGQIDYPTGTEFGAEAVVVCNTGYKPVGQGRYICGDQGWMGRLKTCEVTTCSPPPAVPNASFSPSKESYEYGDVILYRCLKDLVLGGSNSLTCSENGTFIPDPPTCTSVLCKDPESPERNTEWAGGARPPYKHKSTVTLKCKSGYTMNGSAIVTCEINNQWNPPLPVCERVVTTTTTTTTSPPTTTLKGVVSPSTPTTTTTTSRPTKTPKDDASDVPRTLGIVFGVLISVAVITICGCYCFGVPACIKRKRGDRRNNTDKEAPHDGEDVALS